MKVDMATYKAEFLSHYYEGRVRPRYAYAFGLIPWWARPASLAPGVANFFIQTPALPDIAKAAAGMARERRIPRFASRPSRTGSAGAASRRNGFWASDSSLKNHPARNNRVIL